MSDREPENVVVLGGGVAGLAAGYYLARDGHAVTVVERRPYVGGLCASFESHGFTLDHGPHKMYSVVPDVLDELQTIMGDRLLKHEKRNRIRLLGRYLNYPLSLPNLLPLLGPLRSTKMGLDFVQATLRQLVNGREASSYEEYILRRFGRSVYELVFEPLAWKVWGDPRTLSAELAAARIPSGGATDLLLRLLKLKESSEQLDAPYFFYPRRGFGDFPERLSELLREHGGRVRTGTSVERLVRDGGRVTGVEVSRDGASETLACDLLVSSIPLGGLAGLVHPGDDGIREEAARLRLRQLVLIYLVVEQDRLLEDHWVFFPEREFPFSRVFEQKALSEELGPPGRTVICCDLTCALDDDIWRATDESLAVRAARALFAAGLVDEERVSASFVKRFRDFYPVYDIGYRERIEAIYERLGVVTNLVPTGRLGMFNYNNSDHCLDMGRFIANRYREGDSPGAIWTALEERVRGYRIVD